MRFYNPKKLLPNSRFSLHGERARCRSENYKKEERLVILKLLACTLTPVDSRDCHGHDYTTTWNVGEGMVGKGREGNSLEGRGRDESLLVSKDLQKCRNYRAKLPYRAIFIYKRTSLHTVRCSAFEYDNDIINPQEPMIMFLRSIIMLIDSWWICYILSTHFLTGIDVGTSVLHLDFFYLAESTYCGA